MLRFIDIGEQLGDAGLEHLAADDAAMGIGCRLIGEMIAAAETDLEPDLVDRAIEQAARIEGGGC